MSSVFSKLLDKTSAKYGVRQETLTRGTVGLFTVLYLLKLGYPYITARLKNSQWQWMTENRNDSAKQNENGTLAVPQSSSSSSSRAKKNDAVNNVTSINGGEKKRLSVGLDHAFVKQLIMLLRIMVPGWRTKEAGLLACATLTLLTRTFLSVYVATLEGQIVKRIVLRDVHGFSLMLARWFAIALPATFVNSAIRYLEGRLALSFRYAL